MLYIAVYVLHALEFQTASPAKKFRIIVKLHLYIF